MFDYNVSAAIDKGVYIIPDELKIAPENSLGVNQEKNQNNNGTKIVTICQALVPTIIHYACLIILGLLIWGLLWCAWGDGWSWNGPWFKLAIIAVAAWASGLVLQALTTLPALLAALLTGILARNLGYLDMREFTDIDMFLRKIYPVIILGKGAIAWDTNYMKANWRQTAALGVMPWLAEVATLATCTHFILGHPWVWGLLLGTFYGSISGPVIMPNVIRAGTSPRRSRIWPQFVCTAGGVETALSVGFYGVVSSFLFSDAKDVLVYRYIRAAVTMFLAVALGLTWGYIAGFIPHASDFYVVELRILFVLVGALSANFATLHFGWGGICGVAVLVCNATAARHWAKNGWILNNNPASTAYRVMWSACEPILFAYTGTFFVINSPMPDPLPLGFVILIICLTVRLSVAALMCWNLTTKEKLFICCCWSTKSIVEAVLCPMAINILIQQGGTPQEMRYAEDIYKLTVQEILITTPVAFLLTKHLGPILLKDKQPSSDNDTGT